VTDAKHLLDLSAALSVNGWFYLTMPPFCLDTQRGETGLPWKGIRRKGIQKFCLELRNSSESIQS